jgi:hypothetical protein
MQEKQLKTEDTIALKQKINKKKQKVLGSLDSGYVDKSDI